jgi:hypothetical protein
LAKAHEDSYKEDWECVIFSNESSVEKTEDPREIWVFRTAVEERHKECIHGVAKAPWLKLIVGGCIWGPLIPIFEKRVNK